MILVAIVNIIVGALVGISGIAGFLLPIFYTSVMNLAIPEALTLSFSAFIISGVLGSFNYHKKGLLKLKIALYLSVGSFVAAVLGVKANLLIETEIMKIVLYLVVLVSGLSILFRKNKQRKEVSYGKATLVAIGFVTGFICSLTGAGGPILVLPILLLLGLKIHTCVAVSLFNSIFIGIPAAIGYLINSNIDIVFKYLPIVIISHTIGVYLGSKNGDKINQEALKKSVAIFSILIACYQLSKNFI